MPRLICCDLSQQVPPMQRLSAARALGAAKLSPVQQSAVTELVTAAGALEITSLLGAFAAGSDAAAGRRLIAALGSSPGLAALSAAPLEDLLDKYPVDVREELRLRRTEIEAMIPSPTSIMPAGLENTMTDDQLRDLVAYLRSLK